MCMFEFRIIYNYKLNKIYRYEIDYYYMQYQLKNCNHVIGLINNNKKGKKRDKGSPGGALHLCTNIPNYSSCNGKLYTF